MSDQDKTIQTTATPSDNTVEEQKEEVSQEDTPVSVENKQEESVEDKNVKEKEVSDDQDISKEDSDASAKDSAKEEEMQTVVVKGKKKKKLAPFLRGGRGQAHVKASYNNTIVAVTDLNGAVLAWSTAGKCGFKGPRKATPYAAGVIVKSIVDKVKELGIKELDVFVKGVGTGREAAIRAFASNGMHITSIKDVTPIPHGGCRPRKRRRV
jgi:small subunit ribosomal protein S11